MSSPNPTSQPEADPVAIAGAVLAVFAFVLSCLACVCSLKLSRVAMELAYAQVPRSFFEISFTATPAEGWSISFENAGSGPAEVYDFSVISRDGPLEAEPYTLKKEDNTPDEDRHKKYLVRASFERYLDDQATSSSAQKKISIERNKLFFDESNLDGRCILYHEAYIYTMASKTKKTLLKFDHKDDSIPAEKRHEDFRRNLRTAVTEFCKEYDLKFKVRRTIMIQDDVRVYQVTLRLPLDGSPPKEEDRGGLPVLIGEKKVKWTDSMNNCLQRCDESRVLLIC